MSKAYLALGAAALATSGLAAYYVSPVSPETPDVPPIHSELSPVEVAQALRHLEIKNVLAQTSNGTGMLPYLRESVSRIEHGITRHDVFLLNDRLMSVTIALAGAPQGGTDVDVRIGTEQTKLDSHSALHPYDRRIISVMSDLLATEYVGSILERRRMANDKELTKEVRKLIPLSAPQWAAFHQRTETAFLELYQADLQVAETERLQADQWIEEPAEDYPAFAAEQAAADARAAAEAAEEAAREAGEMP